MSALLNNPKDRSTLKVESVDICPEIYNLKKEICSLNAKIMTLETRINVKEQLIQKLEHKNAELCKDLALKTVINEISNSYSIECDKSNTNYTNYDSKIRHLPFDRNRIEDEKLLTEFNSEKSKAKKLTKIIKLTKKRLKKSESEMTKINNLQMELEDCKQIISIKLKNSLKKEQMISDLEFSMDKLKQDIRMLKNSEMDHKKREEFRIFRIKELEEENGCLGYEIARFRLKAELSERLSQNSQTSRAVYNSRHVCADVIHQNPSINTNISHLSHLIHKSVKKSLIPKSEIIKYMRALDDMQEFIENFN